MTSAGLLYRLQKTIYTNNYSLCYQGNQVWQLSQSLYSMFDIRHRGVGTTQHLFLHVHIAVLAACSSVNLCQI